jgi:hypothetical protein
MRLLHRSRAQRRSDRAQAAIAAWRPHAGNAQRVAAVAPAAPCLPCLEPPTLIPSPHSLSLGLARLTSARSVAEQPPRRSAIVVAA